MPNLKYEVDIYLGKAENKVIKLLKAISDFEIADDHLEDLKSHAKRVDVAMAAVKAHLMKAVIPVKVKVKK